MIDLKRFAGVLNNDDAEPDVLAPQHISAKNIRFYGGQQGLTAQNIKGNYLIDNNDLPAGTNECVGCVFDSVNQRLIWANFNSNGNNGWYQMLVQTGVVSKLFLCGTDSVGNVLGFSLDNPIHSVVIVYRTSADGDLLYWTQDNGRPMYLNLATVSALAPFTEDMLFAAKMPPLVPPTVAYGTDATKFYNNVKNRYFRFAYRWVYASLEKSTFSPTSIVPQPTGITNPENNVAPNANNLITVAVNSGSTEDFTKIEIFGQEFNGTTWGDFFLIQSVDKDDVGAIPFTYTFDFLNDGIYPPITPGESDLRFDYVPDIANTLELLNGNTIIYGGITEGYNQLTRSEVDVQVTTSLTSLPSLAVAKTWKWANNERLGLIYFDKRGKTNGVISYLDDDTIDTTNFDVTTPVYPSVASGAITTQVPLISASINHLPPSWAVTYQWVRVDTAPPFFLQYLTNDYQTDSDFIYLCIEGLKYNNTKKGFLPSYEFSEGDRVRVMGTMSFSGGAVTAFSTQYDFQILTVVERVMGGLYNTPTNGSYLKCKRPASFPTPAYSQFMVIEIYTPPKNLTENNAIFYEWGQEYAITGGYHMGQTQNQTISQPALFEWVNGYVYSKYRSMLSTTGINLAALNMCMDRRYNDFQASQANDNSRGWIIEENAKREYFPATVRWGGSYVQDTNINNLNRFLPQDLDTVDRSKGDIRRFKARDRVLRVFQDRGVGQYGIYARYIQNNEGQEQLVTTDSIITPNNISYYQGTFGLSGYPTNLCSTAIADYFNDIVTGREIRLAGDGITDLGLLYKGQFTFTKLATPYNREILRADGTFAKVMKFWDSFDNQAHTILQGGTNSFGTYPDINYSFNENRNGFCCDDYDFHPEWATSANDIIYSWKNGQLWKHDNSVRCNFYGVQFDCYITVVFNPNLIEKKSWQSITEISNDIFSCPLIYTNVMTYGSQRQETNLVEAEFRILEGNPSSSIKRDVNSRGGKINGDSLKGNFAVIKFQKESAENEINLNEILVQYVDSPLTSK